MLRKFVLLFTTAVCAFAMHSVELNVNERDVELQLQFDMGQFNDDLMTDAVLLGAHMLYGGEEHSDIDPDVMFGMSFLMQRTLDFTDDALTLGMGLKLDYTSLDVAGSGKNDFLVLPIGIEADYCFPFDIPIPLHVGGMFYYAPHVLSFQEAENYMEYRGYFDIEIIQGGRIRLGYRKVDTDITYRDLNYNESFYFGFKMAF